MRENFFNICSTCLSCDRLLFPIDKFKDLLIFFNITIYNDYQKTRICWECKAILMKFSKFRKQVLKAQELLTTYNLEETTLSSLKQTINVNTNFNYKENITDLESIKKEYIDDTLVINESIEHNYLDIKNESHHIKDRITERNENITDDIISINDAIENNDEINVLKIKNKRCFTKTIIVKNEIIDDDTISVNEAIESNHIKDSIIEKNDFIHDKIKIITLTEDEIMKNRDMKRNQPNFKKTPFKCDSCVLGFNCKENFDLHYDKKHHESLGRHKCPVCLTRFQSLKEMSRHKMGHYEIYKCNWCDYESLSSVAAFIHCNNKHKEDSHGLIHCDQCDKVVSTPEELKEHIKIKHMLHCEECGEKFKGKQSLRTHKIRIHSSHRKFSCEICSKTFKTQSRFESHITTHDTSMAKNLTYCATCDVQYKNIYIYRRHFKNSKNHTARSWISLQRMQQKFYIEDVQEDTLQFLSFKKI